MVADRALISTATAVLCHGYSPLALVVLVTPPCQLSGLHTCTDMATAGTSYHILLIGLTAPTSANEET